MSLINELYKIFTKEYNFILLVNYTIYKNISLLDIDINILLNNDEISLKNFSYFTEEYLFQFYNKFYPNKDIIKLDFINCFYLETTNINLYSKKLDLFKQKNAKTL